MVATGGIRPTRAGDGASGGVVAGGTDAPCSCGMGEASPVPEALVVNTTRTQRTASAAIIPIRARVVATICATAVSTAVTRLTNASPSHRVALPLSVADPRVRVRALDSTGRAYESSITRTVGTAGAVLSSPVADRGVVG